MNNAEHDPAALSPLVTEALRAADFRRATFGGPVRGSTVCPWRRVEARPIELRGERCMQFSFFDGKKHVSRNYRVEELFLIIPEVISLGFSAIHLEAGGEEIDIRVTKKGKLLIGRRKTADNAVSPELSHNRAKDVPLPEGQANRLLETMGILTRAGTVRPTMRAKYTQINEFLKQLTHVLDDADLRSLGRPIRVLDCGCGASFLTLATHYYLNEVLGIPAEIMGVDINEELIRKSVERSERIGAKQLAFACGPIGAAAMHPDIVLALHACDTATDDALALAVASQARLILSVPCCHHHLNESLRAGGPTEVLRPILRHGILHERAADLITDAFRALALRIMGYRTEIVEFISVEHTARNVMIRALRRMVPGDRDFVREYVEMKRFWGVTPYIELALGAEFQKHFVTDS